MRLVQSTQDNLFLGKTRLAKSQRVVITDHEYGELVAANRISDGTFIDRGAPTNVEIADETIVKSDAVKALLSGTAAASPSIDMDRVEGLTAQLRDKAEMAHNHEISDVLGLTEVLAGEAPAPAPTEDEGPSLVLLFENGLV